MEKGERSLLQLMAIPCIETQRLILMPIAQIFFCFTQTPLLTSNLTPSIPNSFRASITVCSRSRIQRWRSWPCRLTSKIG